MFPYFILGLIQGIVEWLPISSQGQVVLAGVIFFNIPGATAMNTAVWLHVGTMLAAIVYFRKELGMIIGFIPRYSLRSKTKEAKLINFLAVSTIVTGVVGAPLYFYFRNTFAVSSGEILIAIIGVLLIVTGLILRYSGTRKRTAETSLKSALITGIVQAFSALPGISRSGVTTAALLLQGFKAEEALRLSFLMSIFAIAGAEIGLGIIDGVVFSTGSLVAAATAFVIGLVMIDVLMRVAQRIRFWAFCILLGIISLIPLVAL